MYQVLKILNNNTILAKEGNNEIIILAKGIGFGKKEMIILKFHLKLKNI